MGGEAFVSVTIDNAEQPLEITAVESGFNPVVGRVGAEITLTATFSVAVILYA